MSPHRSALVLAALGCTAIFAACGSGSSGSATGGGVPVGPVGVTPTSSPPSSTTAPISTPTPVSSTPTPLPTSTVSTQQVVTMALPSAIGSTTTAFGTIGGYTQSGFSQTLAFAPGSQIMLRNGQTGVPHTFNVLSTTSFPASPALPTSASGSSTIDQNFTSGTISPATMIGPFTLAAGTYFLGCAFHYTSDTMRTVLTVAAGATPGPQATPPGGGTQTPPPGGIGY